MRATLFAASLALAVSQSMVIAQEDDGWSVQAMLYACEDAQAIVAGKSDRSFRAIHDAGRCLGFMRGLGVMLAYNCSSKEMGYSPFYQAAVPPALGAVIQAYVNWARANPEMWGEQAQDGALLAIMDTFPCDV